MARKSKVMLISCLHPWDDTRILYREALTLSNHYDVEVHALADFSARDYEGVKIVGLRAKPRWARPIQWFILGWRAWRCSAQVVHFHDPELLLVGLVLRLLGRQVVYDVHEDVYKDIMYKTWIPAPLRPLVAGVYFMFQKLGDHQMSAIVTATHTIARRFQNRQLVVVRNYPPLEVFSKYGMQFSDTKLKLPVRLIYVGTLSRSRGILEVIRALHYLPEAFVYRLDVVGSFAEERGFKKQVLETVSPVSENVTFHGRLELPNVVQLMSKSHVGLVCTLPSMNDLAGIPLKLFEYMAAGLGVVISDFPLWHTYTENYPPHEFVDSTDPKDIARGIVELVDRWPLYETIWEKARCDTLYRYNWQGEGLRLTNLYNSLILQRMLL